MKVLIVDDNVAIREIIAEILTVDGYEIRQAGTISDAVREIEEFRPEITLLDTIVEGRSTIGFIDSLDESFGTKLILLVNGKEQIPRDTPLIIGSIKKPFKSSDILDAIRGHGKIPKDKIDPIKKERPKIRFISKTKPVVVPDEPEGVTKFGKSYVVFEDSPNEIYNLVRFFSSNMCDIKVVTAERKKTIADKINAPSVDFIEISQKPREGCILYNKLGSLMHAVMDFITESTTSPVVVFEDLSKLVEVNGLNPVITMIYQILTSAGKRCTIAISIKETLLTDKDKQLLFKFMEPYTSEE